MSARVPLKRIPPSKKEKVDTAYNALAETEKVDMESWYTIFHGITTGAKWWTERSWMQKAEKRKESA